SATMFRGRLRRFLDGDRDLLVRTASPGHPGEEACEQDEYRGQDQRRSPHCDMPHRYTRLKRSLSIEAAGAPASTSASSTASIMAGGPQTKKWYLRNCFGRCRFNSSAVTYPRSPFQPGGGASSTSTMSSAIEVRSPSNSSRNGIRAGSCAA